MPTSNRNSSRTRGEAISGFVLGFRRFVLRGAYPFVSSSRHKLSTDHPRNRFRIHREPFVTLYCVAIPAGLLERELFGHEKGAFIARLRRPSGAFRPRTEGLYFWTK